MENTKICSKCGRELPLECFSKLKHSKDGLNVWCKDCFKQYRAEHAEEKAEYMKQYRAEHKEEIAAYDKQYNAEHAEARKQCKKQYYAENVEYFKQYFKQWRADNSDYFKQWRATLEGHARQIRNNNLQEDRKYCRCGKDEDPLPTIEEYIHLLLQPDFYDKKQYHWTEMGLDRIDNTKPHTLDNVVPCSTAHNIQRGRRSFEEFCAVMNKNNTEENQYEQ